MLGGYFTRRRCQVSPFSSCGPISRVSKPDSVNTKRSRKVVPQCVAHEVEFVQFIPGCGQDVPGERSPWRGTLHNDATIGILDPYAVCREVPGARLATERRDRDNRPVSLDTQCHAAQTVRKPLEPPQPAANGHLELEGSNLPPARQAAGPVKAAR